MTMDILLYDAPRIISKEYKKSPKEMNKIGDVCLFNCVCGYAKMKGENFIYV